MPATIPTSGADDFAPPSQLATGSISEITSSTMPPSTTNSAIRTTNAM
jgi:hypothetical protein